MISLFWLYIFMHACDSFTQQCNKGRFYVHCRKRGCQHKEPSPVICLPTIMKQKDPSLTAALSLRGAQDDIEGQVYKITNPW